MFAGSGKSMKGPWFLENHVLRNALEKSLKRKRNFAANCIQQLGDVLKDMLLKKKIDSSKVHVATALVTLECCSKRNHTQMT